MSSAVLPPPATAPGPALALSGLPHGQRGRILGFRISQPEAEWLSAMGIPAGETVTVLRQAPFRGPLHVRAGSGAEFAIDASCAAGIDVMVDPASPVQPA